MSILVLGANGQVGREVVRSLAGRPFVAATREGLLWSGEPAVVADFDRPDLLPMMLSRQRPSLVINAVAYTAVDRAESDAANAFRVNAEVPALIAEWCARHDVPLIHYSTDYVFDGTGDRPYLPSDPTSPLGIYGKSKLAGEMAIRAAGGHHAIVRTAWVHSAHSHNFLRTMLRLARERGQLRVVADQVGTPTPASLIADITMRFVDAFPSTSGVWHLTASGFSTWHGFAEEVLASAAERGLLSRLPELVAIRSSDYPSPARRPAYSCLDCTALRDEFQVVLPAWRDGVKGVMDEIALAVK